MSIKFICSCGKHLRARDEMAARRSMCPRCGAPVGIPSLRPTHPGAPVLAPLTPQERLRRNRHKYRNEPQELPTAALPSSTLPTPVPSAPGDTPPEPKAYRRRRRQLEQYWYQCLDYPFLSKKVLGGLACILSIGLGGIVLSVQNFPPFSTASLHNWLPWSLSVLFLLLITAYAYSTVECALTSALAGKGPAAYLPSWKTAEPLKSSVRWLFCFFTGPIVPAGLAIYFWIYGGDLTALDWAIIGELGILAAGYWFLAILSANERNRLRDANPLRVAQLVERLKYRAVVPVLIAPALAFVHLLIGLLA